MLVLHREIKALEDKKRIDELWPIWETQKNSYWKFRNSYSCPEKESDYWWVHRQITDTTPDGYLDGIEFQVDQYGTLTVKELKHDPWMVQTDGWVPSTRAEWNKAVKAAGRVAGKVFNLSKRS